MFPRGKVSTFVELVVMDQFGIRPLRPASWSRIEFVREDAHGNRDGDAFGIEKPEFAPILPIETRAGKRRVRQPGDRDVVEDVVARKALGLSVKDATGLLPVRMANSEQALMYAPRAPGCAPWFRLKSFHCAGAS